MDKSLFIVRCIVCTVYNSFLPPNPLSGVMVPSLTSLTYYLSFLFLLASWSLHFRAATLVRVLRVFLVLYCTLHLVLLDLYQFQSAQYHIPIHPNDTTSSLLVRYVNPFSSVSLNPFSSVSYPNTPLLVCWADMLTL